MTCAWMDTSSAETGSSPDDQLRIERERAGNADALALAAGELVRKALHLGAAEAHPLEQLRDPFLPFGGAAEAVNPQQLAHDVARRHARIERGIRVLEDDLHLAAHRAHVGLAEIGHVAAVEADRALGRVDQPEHGAPDGGLAAAGLADQPERLAGADMEAHAIDGIDLAGIAGEQPLLDREVLLQPLHLQHGRLGGGFRGGVHEAAPNRRSECQQAAQWPGCFSW